MMKYVNRFLAFAVVLVMITAISGCYKYGEETDDSSLYDIFEDDTGVEEHTEEVVVDTAGELEDKTDDSGKGSSVLSKILKEKQEVAEDSEELESEDVEAEEDDKEETVEEDEESESSDTSMPTKTIKEGEKISFGGLSTEDADGDDVTYEFSKPLDDDGEWQTKVGDAGEYTVTITASDGKTEVTQKVLIVVEGLNSAPVIDIDDIVVDEGDTVELEPEVTDADDDDVNVTYSGWMTSSTKKTSYDDAGVHIVTITATDSKATVTEKVKVTVKDKNRAPELGRINDIVVTEGESVKIRAEAEDPDGDDVEISYGEPLDSEGEWQTETGDAGEYEVEIIASDGDLEDSRTVDITVKSANRAPTLVVEDVLVNVGETVRLNPVVSDPEDDDVTIEYSGWMTSSSKVAKEAGEFEVVVTASDGVSETEKTVTVTVNTPPEIDLGDLL